jgi:hypothetical protein
VRSVASRITFLPHLVTKSYFSQRTAILSNNSMRMKREVSRGRPQGFCCGPGFWNIQYNSLSNLNFTRRTKAVAFAVYLIQVIRGKTVSEAENLTNLEMSKITAWAKSNKINLNEEKSKIILICRRKRKEGKEINVFLNNKLLEQHNELFRDNYRQQI